MFRKIFAFANARQPIEKRTIDGCICYFLVCFKSVDYVSFLLATIYNPEDVFIIHCDKKSPNSLKAYVTSLAARRANVFEIESQDYSWAGFSHVKVTLEAIERAMKLDFSWSHFICLSEQHLPLKSPEQIRDHLRSRKSLMAMRKASQLVESELADVTNRFAAIYRELPGVGCFAIALNSTEEGFLSRVFHGSNWIVLHRDHCRVLMKARAQGEFGVFETAVHAEEMAIQSILAPLRDEIEDVDSTLVAFPHLTDNHSLVMTEELFRSSIASDYLFVRKRPKALSSFVTNHLTSPHFDVDIRRHINSTKLKPSSTKERRVERFVRTIKVFLKKAGYASTNVQRIDPVVYEPAPQLHLVLSAPSTLQGHSIRVLSENFIDYKLCLVNETEFNGVFLAPFVAEEYLHSTIRARLYGLFGCEDILPLHIEGGGFVSVTSSRDVAEVCEKAVLFLEAANVYRTLANLRDSAASNSPAVKAYI